MKESIYLMMLGWSSGFISYTYFKHLSLDFWSAMSNIYVGLFAYLDVLHCVRNLILILCSIHLWEFALPDRFDNFVSFHGFAHQLATFFTHSNQKLIQILDFLVYKQVTLPPSFNKTASSLYAWYIWQSIKITASYYRFHRRLSAAQSPRSWVYLLMILFRTWCS